MSRVIDKLILVALCAFVAVQLPFSPGTIATALLAIAVTALAELTGAPTGVRVAAIVAFVVLGLVWAPAVAFLPLISYDCLRTAQIGTRGRSRMGASAWQWLLGLCWLAPLAVSVAALPGQIVALAFLLCPLAGLMAWHDQRFSVLQNRYRAGRDELSARTHALVESNRNLEERQSLELRVATLAERGRIAREIHDNVGHLLTRSVLQVEALQVVHADQAPLVASLGEVASTLHQAYETVRHSVHGLHDEAFELSIALDQLARETTATTALRVQVDDRMNEPPPPAISRALAAVGREAVSNTLRHSDATHSRIELTEFAGFYQMIVHDNGSGRPGDGVGTSQGGLKPRVAGVKGIGLETMSERVRSLGGVLRTSWDHGFRIFVSVPKPAPQPGDTTSEPVNEPQSSAPTDSANNRGKRRVIQRTNRPGEQLLHPSPTAMRDDNE
ncbi:MAG: histidine kinase [Propionibacteriaceae bacterium]|jgi:signal transduction histidine kinase|nr:histidine kinase [Propionibacteriaceae bacterium]